ncbi:carotenoid 1,2-hydratase [Ectothiorhodospira mobilis]|uniref:carotenoid 1,2-hydratase n=1 Tax=Ectothiorhodospira mobilis TaxID=195064 RepID=UPI001EE7D7E6|nr:carotenoid 1,2-hydratase [Ectothiorhodospira mobilis]MCG5535092.1 carotenoid 1,2-hydratase [Ectothiorhodospira mobilis]
MDALSDDGRRGLTLIAFVGSVFSPYYARARRRGAADPEHHCAVNLALYGEGGKRWAMTERGRGDLARGDGYLAIGPSRIQWDGERLVMHVREITAPLPSRLEGTITFTPDFLTGYRFDLDEGGRHQWRPLAPSGRIQVEMRHPGLRWEGHAYLDSNRGEEPLEAGFRYWDWSRAPMGDGGTVVLYEAQTRRGAHRLLSLRFDPHGEAEAMAPPPHQSLPTASIWRAPRGTRADAGSARVRQTLEDTPFYARSLVEMGIHGETVTAFHESLSLDRFVSPVVQWMLPFRMPRRARG